jgi:hypothetical protein
MKKHSEEVEAILSAGATASFELKAIALAEIDDGKLPHLVVEALGRDGAFTRLFETPLMTAESLAGLQLPVLLRVSMYGQPVVATTIC